jgi:hypothetical protein
MTRYYINGWGVEYTLTNGIDQHGLRRVVDNDCLFDTLGGARAHHAAWLRDRIDRTRNQIDKLAEKLTTQLADLAAFTQRGVA